jgi:hypothetical protein
MKFKGFQAKIAKGSANLVRSKSAGAQHIQAGSRSPTRGGIPSIRAAIPDRVRLPSICNDYDHHRKII